MKITVTVSNDDRLLGKTTPMYHLGEKIMRNLIPYVNNNATVTRGEEETTFEIDLPIETKESVEDPSDSGNR